MFSLVVCGTMYFNVMSFLPLYIADNFGEGLISATMVSICMSMFEVAGIICSPISPFIIGTLGKKRSLIMGMTLEFVSTTGLGLLEKIDTNQWQRFYFLTFVCRFV